MGEFFGSFVSVFFVPDISSEKKLFDIGAFLKFSAWGGVEIGHLAMYIKIEGVNSVR